MSQENVETFRRGIDAFNARDVGALLEVIDRNVEWHPGLAALLGGEITVHRGHDGVRQLVGDLYESFIEIHVELSEVRELDDRVVAVGRLRGRGIESGVDTDSPVAYVAHFKAGRLILLRTYLDPTEALEAAGLRE